MSVITQIIFLVLAGFLAGLAQVIFKILISRKVDSKILTITTFFICAILSIPFLFYQFQVSDSFFIWGLVIISVTSYAYSMFFNFQAYKYIDISIIALIKRLSIVFISLIGIVFLKEKHSFISIIGISLIFFGSIIVIFENKKLTLSKGIIYALLIPITDTIATILDKIILATFSQYSYLFVNNLLISLVFVGQKGSVKNAIKSTKKAPLLIFLSASFMVSSAVLVWTVLKNNFASITMPVYLSCGLIIQVFFGIIFFKETKQIKQKFLGTIICLLGIWLIYQ